MSKITINLKPVKKALAFFWRDYKDDWRCFSADHVVRHLMLLGIVILLIRG